MKNIEETRRLKKFLNRIVLGGKVVWMKKKKTKYRKAKRMKQSGVKRQSWV